MDNVIDLAGKKSEIEKKATPKTYNIDIILNENGDSMTVKATGFLKFGNLFIVVADSPDENASVVFAVATGLFRSALEVKEV